MKKLTAILFLAALAITAPAQTWTGAASTTWDAAGNWSGGVPAELGGTADIKIEGNTSDCPNWPVIDSAMNHQWGVPMVRGPGLRITQTGGTHEWLNGSGISSRGLSLFSRPFAYPTGNAPTNPAVVKLTGGTMITDAVGIGTGGGINRGTFYSSGGDYAEDTGVYRNWQTNPGDNGYGWGRLEIGGTATFIVRPNRYVYPTGYGETNAYWTFDSAAPPTPPERSYRVYDIGIGTNSQMVISDFGKLIAPYKIFTNAILDSLNDRDVYAQLQYYAGLIQAGASPHYVSNGALSGLRLVAGPGQTLQFDLFPAGTNDVNEPYGGYFTVTAVPPPIELSILSAGSLVIKGLVGRQYQIDSKDDLNTAAWDVRTNFTLTASPQTWNDPAPSSTNRFYRAALLPLP